MSLVTIAFPSFNHERFVKQALDSTLHTGLPEVEVLVCDDASTDRTADIISRWADENAARFARFHFIRHKRNTGAGLALQELIAEARGDVIHGLASDDFYLPGGVAAKTAAMLESPGWLGAFCDGQAVDYDGNVKVPSLMSASRINPARLTPESIAEELLYHWDFPGNLMSWRRQAFKVHGGTFEFDGTVFCEDFDFAWWALSQGAFGYVETICYGYRVHDWPQKSTRHPLRETRDVAHVLAKHAREFKQPLKSKIMNLALAHFFSAADDRDQAESAWSVFWGQEKSWNHSSPPPIGADSGQASAFYSPMSAKPAPEEEVFISYAQNFEDVILRRALRSVENGFYVDVGAHDPVFHSVTQAFYLRGWRGVNVEPVPKLMHPFLSQRTRDVNLMVAVSDASGEIEFHEIAETGLSTAERAVAEQHASEGWQVVKQRVSTVTLREIFEKHTPDVVHFLKVDVEGFEAAVLRGMDFEKFRPWIVIVEATRPLSHELSHEQWETHLIAARYSHVYFDGLNRFYVASEKLGDLRPAFDHPPCTFDRFITSREKDLDIRTHLLESRLIATEEQSTRRLEKTRFSLREQIKTLKAENKKLVGKLRHHAANPFRALKLWWRGQD